VDPGFAWEALGQASFTTDSSLTKALCGLLLISYFRGNERLAVQGYPG
jgi:hypothetical protein